MHTIKPNRVQKAELEFVPDSKGAEKKYDRDLVKAFVRLP